MTVCRAVVMFIKNHQFTLALYRKTAHRELRKPADTRFCSQYLMVESVKDNHAHLRSVVTTDEWSTWLASQSPVMREMGEKISDTILSPGFRKKVVELVSVTFPIVFALRKFDGSTPIAGKAYRTMFDTVEMIRAQDIPWVSISD